jgi:hypothetical protein
MTTPLCPVCTTAGGSNTYCIEGSEYAFVCLMCLNVIITSPGARGPRINGRGGPPSDLTLDRLCDAIMEWVPSGPKGIWAADALRGVAGALELALTPNDFNMHGYPSEAWCWALSEAFWRLELSGRVTTESKNWGELDFTVRRRDNGNYHE